MLTSGGKENLETAKLDFKNDSETELRLGVAHPALSWEWLLRHAGRERDGQNMDAVPNLKNCKKKAEDPRGR